MTVNTLGGDVHDGRAVTAWRRLPLVPLCAAIFALAALVSYHVRADGGEPRSALQSLIVGIYHAIGFAPAAMFFVLVVAWSTIWYFTGRLDRPVGRLLRLCGMALALAILVNVRADGQLAMPHTGAIGTFLADRLVGVFGYVLSTLLAMGFTVATVLLATDFLFYRFFEGLGLPEDATARRRRPTDADGGVESDVTEAFLSLARTAPEPDRVAPAPAPVPLRGGVLAPLAATAAVDVTVDDDVAVPAVDAPAAGAAAAAEIADEEAAPEVEPPVYRSRRARRWGRHDDEEPAAGEATETTETTEVGEADDRLAAEPGPAPREAAADDTLPPAGDGSVVARVGDGAEDPVEDAAPRGYLSPILDDGADEVDAEAELADEDETDDETDGEIDAEDDDAAAPADDELTTAIVASGLHEDDAEEDVVAADDGDDPVEAEAEAEAEDETEVEAEPEAGIEDDERDALRASDGAVRGDASSAADEPVVPIPRPAEGVRQQRLFVTVDEALVREAAEVVTATRRASVTHLQRQLRVDYEQAVELLGALARRGVIDWAEGETNGRVR